MNAKTVTKPVKPATGRKSRADKKGQHVILPPLAEDTAATTQLKTPEPSPPIAPPMLQPIDYSLPATNRRSRERGSELAWDHDLRIENFRRHEEAVAAADAGNLDIADLDEHELEEPEIDPALVIAHKEALAHEMAQRAAAAADAERPAEQLGETVIIGMSEPTKKLDGTIEPPHPVHGEAAQPKLLLLNPFTSVLRVLARYDDMRDYLARNIIATSLGYAVILDILRERREARTIDAPQPEVNIFSKWAGELEAERKAERSTELGYYVLPTFHARNWKGVYTRMVYMQNADMTWGPKMPVSMPHHILHALYTGQVAKDEAMAQAYSSYERSLIGETNPALTNILAAKQTIKATRSEADRLQHIADTRSILEELEDTAPIKFGDTMWYAMPLHVQFRYATMVYNQVAKSIGNELTKRHGKCNDLKVEELSKQLALLHIEIESCMGQAEVKAAFEQGKLDDRHDIRIKSPVTASLASSEPTMHRAPPPAPQPDLLDREGDRLDDLDNDEANADK